MSRNKNTERMQAFNANIEKMLATNEAFGKAIGMVFNTKETERLAKMAEYAADNQEAFLELFAKHLNAKPSFSEEQTSLLAFIARLQAINDPLVECLRDERLIRSRELAHAKRLSNQQAAIANEESVVETSDWTDFGFLDSLPEWSDADIPPEQN